MAHGNVACPKCKARMQEGFILDQGHGARFASAWIEGPPEKSFWTGVSLKGKKRIAVQTLRCPSCGYLESYAK
jgi:hypothetical protein